MALSVSLTGSLHFSDSPIIANITIPANTFPDASTMRRCYIRIYPADSPDNYREHKWDADNGCSYDMNVSSSIRSLTPDYDTLSMVNGGSLPTCNFSLFAYVTYMLNGDVFGGPSSTTALTSTPISSMAIRGALSDMERVKLGSQNASALNSSIKLSRKPSSTELATNGQPYLITSVTGASAPSVQKSIVGSNAIPNLFISSTGYEQVFLFRNTLAAPETVCAITMKQESTDFKSDTYSSVSLPSFVPSAKRRSFVESDVVKYEMSSGNTTREWARWWVHEFLAAREWWLLKDNRWIPVTIAPKSNSIAIYDESKPDACHVDFTVTVAYDGDIDSPLF